MEIKEGLHLASGEDIVKYITQRVVQYMDTPQEQRKQLRLTRKNQRDPWHIRWFGLIPMALLLLFRKEKHSKH
jgi:hypothetical protein